MANSWEELENKCYKYLKQKYGQNTIIEPYGKSDSTKADIKIITAANIEFFIEVKAKNSQCCQFVLFPNNDTKSFEFSKRNKVPLSDHCQSIISHMNERYEKYCCVGKKGIPVNVSSSTLYGLVNDFYSQKNVRFFMTEGTDLLIFPSTSFANYFNIEAFYRKKTSGSTEPKEASDTFEIVQGLNENDILGIIEYKSVNEKIRCFLHTDINIKNRKIICKKHTYQFADNNNSKTLSKSKYYVFEVRRLSNTCNPNIICQLSLKKTIQDTNDLQEFENSINKED